jgi:hypothetical protein
MSTAVINSGDSTMPMSTVWWQHDVKPQPSIRLESIDHFKAIGMRQVYGRGDRFNDWTVNLTLWKHRSGRFYARFWSRSQEVDWESWEVIGATDLENQPDDLAVPLCLREQYESWLISNI